MRSNGMRSRFTALLILSTGLLARAQDLYFPPNGSSTWETLDPAGLGWCPDRIDSLLSFLDERNTKAFIVLKDGRLVLEHYFGTFTQDSLWYWASAGKTLTATLAGIAQYEGYLDIDQPTSTYLGNGWTSCTPAQEAAITVRHQLTMTTGLDDAVPDDDCTLPSCLQYLAEPGTRWAYHNAPYTLLDDVIANATGGTFSAYFNSRLRNAVGMDGFWFPGGSPYNNVYISRARSMARFGLLMLNRGVWGADTILQDTSWYSTMTTPSQGINASYGYLWWLNGQSSYMLPETQFVFPGMMLPSAPPDLVSGVGKNDQLVSVSPARGLVVVRMGNPAYDGFSVPTTFANELWTLINALECGLAVPDASVSRAQAWPNPCSDLLHVRTATTSAGSMVLEDATGRIVRRATLPAAVDMRDLPAGMYRVRTSAPGDPGTTIMKAP